MKQNGVGCVLSNVIHVTSSQRHNRMQHFREQNIGEMISLAHFQYFKVQTHVQTAREYPDLNMDFRSFDNGINS